MILISGHNNVSMIRIEKRKNRITLPGRPYLYKLQRTSQYSKEWWTLSCHTKFQELQYWRPQIIKIWSHILTLQRLQLRPLKNFTPLRQSQQDYERINDKEVSILPIIIVKGQETWPLAEVLVWLGVGVQTWGGSLTILTGFRNFFAFFDVLFYLFSESFDQPQVSQSEGYLSN